MGEMGGGRAWGPGATPHSVSRLLTPSWRWRSSGSPWTAARSRLEWWTTMVRALAKVGEGIGHQPVPKAAIGPSWDMGTAGYPVPCPLWGT